MTTVLRTDIKSLKAVELVIGVCKVYWVERRNAEVVFRFGVIVGFHDKKLTVAVANLNGEKAYAHVNIDDVFVSREVAIQELQLALDSMTCSPAGSKVDAVA